MENIEIRRFILVRDKESDTNYRILNINQNRIAVINANTPNCLNIVLWGTKDFYNKIMSGKIEIIKETDSNTIVNNNDLPPHVQKKYLRNKLIIDSINTVYAPEYIGLTEKRKKPVIEELILNSGLTRTSVWAIIIKYLQSGCKESSLLRKPVDANLADKTTTKKRGRTSEIQDRNGKIITDEDRKIMEKYMKMYADNKFTSMKKCYDDMIIDHYTSQHYTGDSFIYQELPADQRPTFYQFTYYIRQHMPTEERHIAKMGKREYRNQKRLLTGTALNDTTGPGDIVEMDACELDISVVSALNRKEAVGSPVVYFMLDVYSRLILAASLSFDNNSILAMTNCLASLVEDKPKLLESLGLTIVPTKSGLTLDDVMPSNIKPRTIRVDHGSDFISKQSQRIANELNIELQYAPPGTGSYKGVVERSFRTFQAYFLDLVLHAGAKEHTNISKHNTKAKLTIEDVKKLLYSFILQYNTTQHESRYHLTPDMVKNKVGHIPAEVFRYGIQHAGNPPYITDVKQFLFSLLIPVNASLRRSGIHYKGLRYIPDLSSDLEIQNIMMSAKNGSIPFAARIDLRTVSTIYYIDDSKNLRAATMVNDANHREFAAMTWPEFEKFQKEERLLSAQKEVESAKTRRAHRRIDKETVKEAKAASGPGRTNTKNMRETRAVERSRVAQELSFGNRFSELAPTSKPTLPEPPVNKPSKPDTIKPSGNPPAKDTSKMSAEEYAEYQKQLIINAGLQMMEDEENELWNDKE